MLFFLFNLFYGAAAAVIRFAFRSTKKSERYATKSFRNGKWIDELKSKSFYRRPNSGSNYSTLFLLFLYCSNQGLKLELIQFLFRIPHSTRKIKKGDSRREREREKKSKSFQHANRELGRSELTQLLLLLDVGSKFFLFFFGILIEIYFT